MAGQQPSYAQLTRDVVQASPELLTVDEIVVQVNGVRAITTKNPKNTIRAAIGDSAMIVFTGDGRYGWKPRVINGSILRHTFRGPDILMEVLQWSDELQDGMCPSYYAKEQYKDLSPAMVTLPDGTVVEFPFEQLTTYVCGTHATPTFWEWLTAQQANAGDHLLIRIINAEERRYNVTFQARRDRDETAVATRNEVFMEMIAKMRDRPYGAAPWDITTHALARGLYQHPIPPDPLPEIWREDIWHARLYDELEELRPESEPDPLLSALFDRPAQVYDPENPPDLPREYDPKYGRRRPRPSRKASEGDFTSFILRVNHRALPKVWRDIELAEDQTLEDLHLQIQQAFGWYDDHLYSFFMSGTAWDQNTEISCPWCESRTHTHQVQIAQLGLTEGRKFLYLFDYGDNHEFDVTVRQIDSQAPKGEYPKIVGRRGKAPEQYPDFDDETGEMSWDPHSHWG